MSRRDTISPVGLGPRDAFEIVVVSLRHEIVQVGLLLCAFFGPERISCLIFLCHKSNLQMLRWTFLSVAPTKYEKIF